jgi:hypothetical protein
MQLPNESVFLKGLKAEPILAIVKELRALGLVQGTDFEFRYQQDKYINGDWTEGVEPGGAEFYFREGKWATYLALKYGN